MRRLIGARVAIASGLTTALVWVAPSVAQDEVITDPDAATQDAG